MSTHKIIGEWRGRYEYDGTSTPGGDFTIWFAGDSGQLTGEIVDQSSAGRASLTGTFESPTIKFTKFYLKPTQTKRVDKHQEAVPKHSFSLLNLFKVTVVKEHDVVTETTETFGTPVEYEGIIGDDGQTLTGTWAITAEKGATKGTWSAKRR